MSDDRTLGLHAQLVRTHHLLRRRLYALVDALETGDPPDPDGGRELLDHCLGFCAALTTHHTGEDDGLFAALREARPDLGPTLDKLRWDHQAIAGILGQVDTLTRRATTAGPAERTAIARQLDGLSAIMDSHFGYEERALRAALDDADDADDPGSLGDRVADASWTAAVFTPERLSAPGSPPG